MTLCQAVQEWQPQGAVWADLQKLATETAKRSHRTGRSVCQYWATWCPGQTPAGCCDQWATQLELHPCAGRPHVLHGRCTHAPSSPEVGLHCEGSIPELPVVPVLLALEPPLPPHLLRTLRLSHHLRAIASPASALGLQPPSAKEQEVGSHGPLAPMWSACLPPLQCGCFPPDSTLPMLCPSRVDSTLPVLACAPHTRTLHAWCTPDPVPAEGHGCGGRNPAWAHAPGQSWF